MYDVKSVEEFWVNLYKNKFSKEILIIVWLKNNCNKTFDFKNKLNLGRITKFLNLKKSFYMVFMFYSLPPMYSGMYVYLLLKLRAKGDMKISCDNKGRCNVSNKLSYQQCEFSDHWQIFCTMYA